MRGVTVKIAEVSKKYGLSADTLRYYERAGLLGQVTRTKSGIRNYSDEDCERIEFVMTMRNAGIPVEMLAEYVSLFERGEEGAICARPFCSSNAKSFPNESRNLTKHSNGLTTKSKAAHSAAQRVPGRRIGWCPGPSAIK